jgi:iron complex transport system permease protein
MALLTPIYCLSTDCSSPIRLILVGVGFSPIVTALTTLMITFGDINSVSTVKHR